MSARRWLPVLLLAIAIPAAHAQPLPKQAPTPTPTPKQAPTPTPTPKQAPPPKQAPSPVVVSCDFLEIGASSAATPSLDPALEKLKKKFKKPPFSSWNAFKLLTNVNQPLTQKKAESVKLKLGQATATLLGIVNSSNVRLSISIDDTSGKNWVNTTSTFAAGDFVVFGHSLPNNEGHLLALTCK